MAHPEANEYFRRQAVLSHYDLAEPVSQDAIDYATAQAMASVTGEDLIDQLFDVSDLLVDLIRAGKTEQVGAVVSAVCKGYAARLGMRDISDSVADAMPDARRLAYGVLLDGLLAEPIPAGEAVDSDFGAFAEAGGAL